MLTTAPFLPAGSSVAKTRKSKNANREGEWVRRCSGLALAGVICACASGRALAHGHYDPGELGHHWNVPIYLSEIHFQLACMAVVTAAIFVVRLISRVRCSR